MIPVLLREEINESKTKKIYYYGYKITRVKNQPTLNADGELVEDTDEAQEEEVITHVVEVDISVQPPASEPVVVTNEDIMNTQLDLLEQSNDLAYQVALMQNGLV